MHLCLLGAWMPALLPQRAGLCCQVFLGLIRSWQCIAFLCAALCEAKACYMSLSGAWLPHLCLPPGSLDP